MEHLPAVQQKGLRLTFGCMLRKVAATRMRSECDVRRFPTCPLASVAHWHVSHVAGGDGGQLHRCRHRSGVQPCPVRP